jgi:predicted heme/steroid binding protein/uncharacterized membrane protein
MVTVAEKPDQERQFTPADLAAGNGADGAPVLIAFRGKVYDVSGSGLWEGGGHMDQHHAGHDLTGEFPDAPHGEEVFERYPQVGVLKAEPPAAAPPPPSSPAREFCRRLVHRVPLLRRHPHPMVVHFPIVFMMAAPVFTLLALFTGVNSFAVTGFHCLAGGLLFTPVAIVTGWFTWWFNYESRWLTPVVIKVILSPLLLLVGTVAFVWRWHNPEILAQFPAAPCLVYLGLLWALVPMVAVIGACGAELTFPVNHE